MANTQPLSEFTGVDPYLSDTLKAFAPPVNPGYLVFDAFASNDATAKAGDGVFTTYPVNDPAVGVPTFYNDWYFRIHFVPAALDLGNLLSNQSREVVVWNAYFDAKPVSSFALSAGDGISVTQPAPAPYDMAPLGLYTYTVLVDTLGPPTITANLSWTIDGIGYTVPITGRRVVVWAFKPDWANPVDETLEWMTAIETAFDRTEHRVDQREQPRRGLEYTTQIVGADTGLFETAMFGWADRLFALPLWQEKSTLTAAVDAGAISLSLPVADRSYIAGGLLVLYASPSRFEAIEIDTVLDDVITLKDGTELSWPLGTSVFPIMVSRLDGAATPQYVAEDKLTVRVRFSGSPANAPTRMPVIAPEVTFNGVEVYTEGTNWIRSLDVSIEGDYDLHDNPFGVFQTRPRSGWPTIVKAHEWLSKSRAEATTLRGFFARRKGRLAPVWMPTGTADFKLVSDVVLTDTVLSVIDNGYGQLIAQHPARNHVLIQLRGGVNIVREIDTVTPQGDGTANLKLIETVGVSFTTRQLRRISYIGLYRLAGDAVTISHKTTTASVVQTSFQLTRPGPT